MSFPPIVSQAMLSIAGFAICIGFTPNAASGAEPLHQELVLSFHCSDVPLTFPDLGGLEIQADADSRLHASGRTAKGLTWTVALGPCAGYNSVWKADLSGDGDPEIVLDQRFPYNGQCYAQRAFTPLPFDQRGLPVPWRLATFYDERVMEERGPHPLNYDVVTWPERDATVVLQTDCYAYEYRESQAASYRRKVTAPYAWPASYRYEQGRWRRLSPDEHRELQETHWEQADSPGRSLAPRPDWERPFIRDWSSVRGDEPLHRIIEVREEPVDPCPLGPAPRYQDFERGEDYREAAVRWAQTCGYRFRLDDGRTCEGPHIAVIDEPSGRRAAVEREPSEELLLDAFIGGYQIRLSGQIEEGLCSPAMLWATHPELMPQQALRR